jgi:hypothetical protein
MKAGVGLDFTIATATITMTTAPATGTVLLADYEVASSTFDIGVNNFITNEVPAGLVNSSNAAFTTASSFIAGTLQVYINGVKQLRTTHYSETVPASGTFAMSDAPITGDVIEVAYQHNLASTGDADTVDGIHANATATANQLMPLDANAKLNYTNFYNPYKFSAYRNAAQNSGNLTFAIVNFDTELFDTNSNFDVATNVGRYTAPVAGFYQFNARASFTSTTLVLIALYKNGSIYKRGSHSIGNGTYGANISELVQASAGDYFEIFSFGTGGAIEVGSPTTSFNGYLVSTL